MSAETHSDPEHWSGAVPDDDRAFRYGDGVFETLLVIEGKILWPALHLERLALGARRLDISFDLLQTRKSLERVAAGCEQTATVVRLTLSRGSGRRGYLPERNAPPRFRISASPLDADPLASRAPLSLALSSIFLGEQPLLAGIKHCNRLEQVLAASEAARLGVDDVLMRRTTGFLQCTSRCNFFLLRDECLLTPPCDRSGILGTRRRLVVETLAPILGIEAREAELTVEDLDSADACFVTGTLAGIRRVARIGEWEFCEHELLSTLQHRYVQEAQACLRA